MLPKSIKAFLCFFPFSILASQIQTVKSGNWSDPTIWSSNKIPTSSDDVYVVSTHQIIINSDVNCRNLIIGNGVAAVVKFDATKRSVHILESLTIQVNAQLLVQSTGSQLGHVVDIGKDLINSGKIDLYGSSTRAVSLRFSGSTNSTITNTGEWFDVFRLNIAKSQRSNMVRFISENISFQNESTNGFLELNGGTFSLEGTQVISTKLMLTANYMINSNSELIIDNPNLTILGQNGVFRLEGGLMIKNGNYYIGDRKGNDFALQEGGEFNMVGGNCYVASSITPYGQPTYYSFIQEGGELHVACKGNDQANSPSFYLDKQANCYLKAGVLILEQANKNQFNPKNYVNLARIQVEPQHQIQFGKEADSVVQFFYNNQGFFSSINCLSINGSIVNFIGDTLEIQSIHINAGVFIEIDSSVNYFLCSGNIRVNEFSHFFIHSREMYLKGNIESYGQLNTFSTVQLHIIGMETQILQLQDTFKIQSLYLENLGINNGLEISGIVEVDSIVQMGGNHIVLGTNSQFILGVNASIIGEKSSSSIFTSNQARIQQWVSLEKKSNNSKGCLGMSIQSTQDEGLILVKRFNKSIQDGFSYRNLVFELSVNQSLYVELILEHPYLTLNSTDCLMTSLDADNWTPTITHSLKEQIKTTIQLTPNNLFFTISDNPIILGDIISISYVQRKENLCSFKTLISGNILGIIRIEGYNTLNSGELILDQFVCSNDSYSFTYEVNNDNYDMIKISYIDVNGQVHHLETVNLLSTQKAECVRVLVGGLEIYSLQDQNMHLISYNISGELNSSSVYFIHKGWNRIELDEQFSVVSILTIETRFNYKLTVLKN